MSDLSEWGVDPDDGDEREPDNPCPQCGEEMESTDGPCGVGFVCTNTDCARDR